MKCVNYSRAAALLLGCFVVSVSFNAAQAAVIPVGAVPAYTMDTVSLHDNTDGSHYSIGYTFTTTAPVQVLGLGALDFGGTTIAAIAANPSNSTTGFPVNLYYTTSPPPVPGNPVDGGQTSGTLVPGFSVTVTPADPILSPQGGVYTPGTDGFRYDLFATPLTLPAGTYQLVESQFGSLNNDFATNASTPAAAFSGVQQVNYAFPNNTAAYATNVSTATSAFGPNLLLAPVPEPASLVLCGMGLLGLFVMRRTRRPEM